MNDAKFWARVERQDGGCWLWLGTRTPQGYGMFSVSHKVSASAHRFAYYQFRGVIPDGLTLDHLCRVRHCVNPDHLEAVRGAENTARGTGPSAINARKTHCVRGHALTPENVLITKNKWRLCRTCLGARHDAWTARRRELRGGIDRRRRVSRALDAEGGDS